MDWLRIHVSNLCNFKCPNCHVFELGENNLPNRVMSQEIFNQSLDQYLNVMSLMGHKRTMISLYGGETLANKKVIKEGILRYGSRCNGIELNWVINTNGSLLKEEDVEFFKEHKVEIHVSVDGAEEVHNISRPTHKGKGTFHMVVPALELIKKHKAPAQINSYMMPSNYLHLNDIVDIAHQYGIKKIYLDQFYNLDMISHQVGMERYRQVFYYAVEKGIAISGPWGRVIKRSQSLEHKRDILEEKLGIDINMDGTFYFPVMSGSKKIHREIKDLTAFFETGNWKKTIGEAQAYYDEKCDGCSIKDHCYGSAIEQVHYHIGVDADPAVSCNFFRDWCSFLLRPVYFKQFEKLDLVSMIDLNKVDPMISKISGAIKILEDNLWPLKEKILVNLSEYPEELKLASGQPNLPQWVRATTSGSRTLHHMGTEVTPGLTHELTHLFIAQRQLRLPHWFVEGLCEWTQDQTIDAIAVKNALSSKNLFEMVRKPENEHLNLIDFDKNLPFENAMYMQAKAFVGHLHQQLGNDKFNLFLDSCTSYELQDALVSLGYGTLDEYVESFNRLYA